MKSSLQGLLRHASDLLDVADLVEEVRAWWHKAKDAAVGETVEVPEMVVDIGHERWRIPKHTATREK